MTSTRCSDGKCSRKLRTTGTDTLYGRFATSAVGAGSSESTVIASAWTTFSFDACCGANRSTVAGSCAARFGSTSTTLRCATAGSSASVNDPSPGPTSTTVSSAPTPARRTILRTVFGSMTKFCPHVFVGRTP